MRQEDAVARFDTTVEMNDRAAMRKFAFPTLSLRD